LTCEFPDDLKQKHWSVTDALGCKTTTVSAIGSSLSEEETTITADQTEESIWSTMSTESSESSEEENILEIDVWYWVMIVFAVLCLLPLLCIVVILCYGKCRYPNRGQNENHQPLQTSDTAL
jgi:hypothetical protein